MLRRRFKVEGVNVGISLSNSMIDALDVIACENKSSRSYLIRFAIEKTFSIKNDLGFGNIKHPRQD